LVKIAISLLVAVAVIEIEITEDPDCGRGYELITVTTTGCTPLKVGMKKRRISALTFSCLAD
jgi:hypothetical protein